MHRYRLFAAAFNRACSEACYHWGSLQPTRFSCSAVKQGLSASLFGPGTRNSGLCWPQPGTCLTHEAALSTLARAQGVGEAGAGQASYSGAAQPDRALAAADTSWDDDQAEEDEDEEPPGSSQEAQFWDRLGEVRCSVPGTQEGAAAAYSRLFGKPAPAHVLHHLRLAHTAVSTSQRQEPAADTHVPLTQRKQAQRDALYKSRLEQLVHMLGPDAAARMLNHAPDVLDRSPDMLQRNWEVLKAELATRAPTSKAGARDSKDAAHTAALMALRGNPRLIFGKPKGMQEHAESLAGMMGLPTTVTWPMVAKNPGLLNTTSAKHQQVFTLVQDWLMANDLPGPDTDLPLNHRWNFTHTTYPNDQPMLLSKVLHHFRGRKLAWVPDEQRPAWLQSSASPSEVLLAAWPRQLLQLLLWPGLKLDGLPQPSKRSKKVRHDLPVSLVQLQSAATALSKATHSWSGATQCLSGAAEDAWDRRAFLFTRACLVAQPRLLYLSEQRLKANLQLLQEAAAWHPAWHTQLRCMGPPALGRVLMQLSSHFQRVRLVVQEDVQAAKVVPLHLMLCHDPKPTDAVTDPWRGMWHVLRRVHPDLAAQPEPLAPQPDPLVTQPDLVAQPHHGVPS